MIRKALLLTIVLSAVTFAIYRGANIVDGDPYPWCPPICAP